MKFSMVSVVVIVGSFFVFASVSVCSGKNLTVQERSFSLGSFNLNSVSKPTLPTITLPSLPTFTLPTLPSISIPTKPSFSNLIPSIPTTGLSNLFTTDYFGDFNLFQTFDNLLSMKNRLPNVIAQYGNFSLLQITLLLAFTGIIAGVAILLAEAKSFKGQEEQEYYFKHKIPEVYGPPQSQYGVPTSYGPPQTEYGQPITSGYSSYSNSHNRRQLNVLNTNPINYQNVQPGSMNRVYTNTDNRSNLADSKLTLTDRNNSTLRFPTFNRNHRKKIMFG